MNPLEFFLAIIVIIFLFKLAKLRMQHHADRAAGAAEDEREQLLDRLVQLEQRIQVLERIVTDRSADLHRQFEDLGR